jgi:hypothetical protein
MAKGNKKKSQREPVVVAIVKPRRLRKCIVNTSACELEDLVKPADSAEALGKSHHYPAKSECWYRDAGIANTTRACIFCRSCGHIPGFSL